jgi:hypothetical protein
MTIPWTFKIPKFETPREVAAAAIASLYHGAGYIETIEYLRSNGVQVEVIMGRSHTSVTCRIKLSQRKNAEATCGNTTDALAIALHDALTSTRGEA